MTKAMPMHIVWLSE